MFHRIEPTIFHMGAEIGLVADVMFPKPALPYPTFAPHDMAGPLPPPGRRLFSA